MLRFETNLSVNLRLLTGKNLACHLTIFSKEKVSLPACREAVCDAFLFLQDNNYKRTPDQFAQILSKIKPDWDIVLRSELESITVHQHSYNGVTVL